MKTRTGEDSLELYQACILPLDQFALGTMPDTRLEDIAAHDLMRVLFFLDLHLIVLSLFTLVYLISSYFSLAANIVHNLTLRGHHWRIRFMEAEAHATRLEKEKVAIEAEMRSEYETRLKTLESKLSELETRARESSAQTEREEVVRLAREGQESFARARGREAGGSQLSAFANRPTQARRKGAQDFKTSLFLTDLWWRRLSLRTPCNLRLLGSSTTPTRWGISWDTSFTIEISRSHLRGGGSIGIPLLLFLAQGIEISRSHLRGGGSLGTPLLLLLAQGIEISRSHLRGGGSLGTPLLLFLAQVIEISRSHLRGGGSIGTPLLLFLAQVIEISRSHLRGGGSLGIPILLFLETGY
ncbi:hypothetical protein DH2020_012378 [Rehmannia glutinosa]|uniref:Uncharacterized protein n=1 Tax=Rehmannia glutinosa TaxID=99300 RepID=A0ABR0WZX7_REHGL